MSRFFKDIIHLDKSSFSLTAGLRAAAFVIAPIILAFVIQQPALFLAAIGAIVLTATAKMLPTIPSRILLLACFTDAASGKTQLLAKLDSFITPTQFSRYFEPFLGGGALFFHPLTASCSSSDFVSSVSDLASDSDFDSSVYIVQFTVFSDSELKKLFANPKRLS